MLHTIERLDSLAKRGHSVVACTSGSEGYNSKEIVGNLTIMRSGWKKKKKYLEKAFHHLYFFLWAILQIIIKKYDVVHIGSLPGNNSITASICGIIFSGIIHFKGARTVYLYSLAETESEVVVTTGLSGGLRKIFLRSIDRIVVNSPGLYNGMKEMFPTSTRIIINGVKDEVFQPNASERESLRNMLKLSEEDVIFTFLGTICERKGVDILLNAYNLLSENNKNFRLWLIGPFDKKQNQNLTKSQEPDIRTLADGNNRIKFIGRIDDREELAKLLNASDIFVFPTRREGMPMAPLQAMSSGLPVIISYIPGITDLANIEGETGLYITPGSSDELKSAMLKLAENPALRKAMGGKARDRIVNDFSWQQHVDRWEQLYLGKLND
ncbi:MAG: glycosyltransferase family 4 protein [Peptococcaceae bacterium]|nr:glycosyltransferase family 4 protein [Peptococcaceae bacterium]